MSKPGEPAVLHPYLFLLYPPLAIASIPANDITFPELVPSMVFLLLATLGLLTLVTRHYGDRPSAGLFVSLGGLCFFSYGHLFSLLQDKHLLGFMFGRHRFLLAAWGGLSLLLYRHFRRAGKRSPALTLYLNVVSVILLCIALGRMGVQQYAAAHKNPSPVNLQRVGVPLGQLPNIYYIILDGYARDDVLLKNYQHDNAAFLDWLEGKGFYVARGSHANYNFTLSSLASSLNMSLLEELRGQWRPHRFNLFPFRQRILQSDVLRTLKDSGYRIIAFSTGYLETEMPNADLYIRPVWRLGPLEHRLINSTPLPFLRLIKIPVLQRYSHRVQVLYTLDHLDRPFSKDRPVFVFAHLVCPHPPFVFDQNGGPVAGREPFTFRLGELDRYMDRQTYVRKYRGQLVFISRRIAQALERILAGSQRPCVIVLQSDHGPAFFAMADRNDFLEERMAILNAYYFPDRDYSALYPEITPVNTFRVILNKYLQMQLPLLEDRSYLLEDSLQEGRPSFAEVTDTFVRRGLPK